MLSHLGGFGLLILNFIDSSPLFLPFGNDLFMIDMTARKHQLLFYYVVMSSVGSVLGCLVLDALSRKGGEMGFKKTVSPRRFDYIKKRVTKNAAWALVVACLAPPPFPYTPVVAGTAAFQYPRKRLLAVVFVSRFVRFSVDGVLAILFSRRIIRLAHSPIVYYAVIVLIVLSVGVSAFIVVQWIKRSRTAKPAQT